MLGGGAKRQNLVHLKNVVFNPYLDNPLSEIIQTWTRGTIEGWLSFCDIGPQSPYQGVGLEVKI